MIRAIVYFNIFPKEKLFSFEINKEYKWYEFVSTNYKNPAGVKSKFHSKLNGYYLNPIQSRFLVPFKERPFTQYQLFDFDPHLGWKNKSNFNIKVPPRNENYTTNINSFRITSEKKKM